MNIVINVITSFNPGTYCLQVAELMADGKIKLEVGGRVELEEVAQGQEQLEKGDVRGKILVSIW